MSLPAIVIVSTSSRISSSLNLLPPSFSSIIRSRKALNLRLSSVIGFFVVSSFFWLVIIIDIGGKFERALYKTNVHLT